MAFRRLALKEPISSLKELGEQKLKKFYDIIILTCRLHKVLPIITITGLIEAVRNALQGRSGAGLEPALVDHPAEPVPTGVLISAAPTGSAPCLM